MRRLELWVSLLALTLLTACGSSPGQSFNPYPSKGSSASQSTGATSTGTTTQFPTCYSAQPASTDATFNAAYASATLCTGGTQGATVQLNVGTGVPNGTLLCVVPFVYNADLAPVCQIVSGTALFTLSTTQYTSLVILPEAFLSTYENYIVGTGSSAPSRVLFSI